MVVSFHPDQLFWTYRSVVCLFTYRLLKGLPITIYKNYYRTHMFINDWCHGVANLTNQNTFDNLFSKQELDWLGSGNSKVPVFNIGGTEYDVFSQLNLPHVAVGNQSLTTAGLITLAAACVVTLLFAVLGGKAGDVFHRRVDRFAAREYVEPV